MIAQRFFVRVGAGCALLALAAAPCLAGSAAFDAWLDAFTADWVRQNPNLATQAQFFSGAEQDALDGRLTSYTVAARRARVERARAGLAELAKFDRAALAAGQRVSSDMLAWQLDQLVRAEEFADFDYVFRQSNGLQVRLVNFLTQIHPVRSRRDVENYLARLGQVAAEIGAGIAQAEDRARRGFVPPKSILASAIAQLDRFLAGTPRDNVFVGSLDERAAKLADLPAAERAAFVAAAETIVTADVIPAFRRVRALLVAQQADAGEAVGLGRFPGGDRAYAQVLRELTTTDYTPRQIHEIGLQEVARIEAEMDGYLKQLGFAEGTIQQRMEALDDRLQPPAEPDPRPALLARYTEILRDAERRAEPLFDVRPAAACEVRREPPFTEKTASAHYTFPARDGSRPGVFWVPLPGPKFRAAGMRTLVYHEAIPGHHFQVALQGELAELPRFRRDRLFGTIPAHGEGWALYAEFLAAEFGWYEGDLVGRLGQLNAELFRARRLVVDTGIHALGWSREQALAYGLPVENPVAEVKRYIVAPGQACSYKIGLLRILDLRARARRELGEKFSLKEFHNVILRTGTVPLATLERVIDDWVAETRKN